MFLIGELKSTKAYNKWAKKVAETKPPTSPLRRKAKWVSLCVTLRFISSELTLIYKLIILEHFTGQINSQNQISMHLYLSAEMKERTGLIPCSLLWYLNMVGMVLLLNLMNKNLRLHKRRLKAAGSLRSQSESLDCLVEVLIYLCINSASMNTALQYHVWNYSNMTVDCMYQLPYLFKVLMAFSRASLNRRNMNMSWKSLLEECAFSN